MKDSNPTEVHMKWIEPDPDRPRKVFKTEEMKELVESIERGARVPPITVRTVGNKYRIIAGERYWRAAGLARLETVPVEVRDDLRSRGIRLMQLKEDYHREKVSPIDQGKAWMDYMERYDVSMQQLADELAISYETVGYYVGLVKDLHSSLWDKVERGFVGGLSLAEASLLAKVGDKERQVSVYQTFIGNRVNLLQLEQLVSAVNRYPDVPSWTLLEQILEAPGTRARDEEKIGFKSLAERISEFSSFLDSVDLRKCLEEEGGFWPDLYREDLIAQLDSISSMANKIREQLSSLHTA